MQVFEESFKTRKILPLKWLWTLAQNQTFSLSMVVVALRRPDHTLLPGWQRQMALILLCERKEAETWHFWNGVCLHFVESLSCSNEPTPVFAVSLFGCLTLAHTDIF